MNEQRCGDEVRARAWPSSVIRCGKAMVTKMLEAKLTSEPTDSAMPRMRSGKISLSRSHEIGPKPTCAFRHNHRHLSAHIPVLVKQTRSASFFT